MAMNKWTAVLFYLRNDDESHAMEWGYIYVDAGPNDGNPHI